MYYIYLLETLEMTLSIVYVLHYICVIDILQKHNNEKNEKKIERILTPDFMQEASFQFLDAEHFDAEHFLMRTI